MTLPLASLRAAPRSLSEGSTTIAVNKALTALLGDMRGGRDQGGRGEIQPTRAG